MRIHQYFLATLCGVAFAPAALANTVTSRTSVEANMWRPNEDGHQITLNQSLSLDNGEGLVQSISTGYSLINHQERSPVEVIPVQYRVSYTEGRFNISGTLGMNFVLSNGEEHPMINFSATIPIGNSATLRGTAGYDLIQADQAIDRGIGAVTLSPEINWQIDRRTNLMTAYQVLLVDDGNTQHKINIRIQHNLNEQGTYITGHLFYFDSEEESPYYWSPNDYLGVGVEVGQRFRISEDLACQVAIIPGFSVEAEEDPTFRVGGGAGCQITLGSRDQLEVSARGGYGFVGRIVWNHRF